LSEGVASDILISNGLNDAAMSAVDFKKAIKARMQNLKK